MTFDVHAGYHIALQDEIEISASGSCSGEFTLGQITGPPFPAGPVTLVPEGTVKAKVEVSSNAKGKAKISGRHFLSGHVKGKVSVLKQNVSFGKDGSGEADLSL